MKILVTGGAGFIGSAVVRMAIGQGHEIINLDKLTYAANLENQDKANDIILGLADLLRYQLESNKKQKTLLINEIESLESYIALEKIRVLDCEVQLEKQGKDHVTREMDTKNGKESCLVIVRELIAELRVQELAKKE